MARGADSLQPLYDLARKLFFSRAPVDIRRVSNSKATDTCRVLTDLPNYEGLASKDWRYRPFPVHDLLGTKLLGTHRADVSKEVAT